MENKTQRERGEETIELFLNEQNSLHHFCRYEHGFYNYPKSFLTPEYPVCFNVLCSSDRERNGMSKSQKYWPLRHCSLNKTKPNAYRNVWGRRGFTLEQSCSNMRYLHNVQLPSHCGLVKQYSSPILPPPPKKKPSPKLVFLWPVIKTWVWMRASVSPGKITHTHSQRGGNNTVYSGPPQHLIGEKLFILTDLLSRLADKHNWLQNVLHLSNCFMVPWCTPSQRGLMCCLMSTWGQSTARARVCILIIWVRPKGKAVCQLLISFRAHRVWSLSHDNSN